MNPNVNPNVSPNVNPIVPETLEALPPEHLPADLVETEAGWRLVLALPGVAEADLELLVERGTLTISATRRGDVPEGARVLRRGPGPARLEREFLLPDGVGPEAVTASLEAGLLHVEITRPAPARIAVPIRKA